MAAQTDRLNQTLGVATPEEINGQQGQTNMIPVVQPHVEM